MAGNRVREATRHSVTDGVSSHGQFVYIPERIILNTRGGGKAVMAKIRSKGTRTPGSDKGAKAAAKSSGGSSKESGKGMMSAGSMRETVESIVIAIILAFLFRTFEAEAFVIPTGSMAPTLQGRHIDVECPQCKHWYRTGASNENPDSHPRSYVVATTCPVCRFTQTLDRNNGEFEAVSSPGYNAGDPNQTSFTGDRILVNKFIYSIFEPTRWDIIVFKYPGNAKQNFIKRLVGLPEEVIRIWHGDVYTLAYSELTNAERQKLEDPALPAAAKRDMVASFPLSRFTITRKPPRKLRAMLQLVHDSDHISPKLREAGFPSRWQELIPDGGKPAWKTQYTSDGKARYTASGGNSQDAMLRYHHLPPRNRPLMPEGQPKAILSDWERVFAPGGPSAADKKEFNDRRGALITDFYTYNAATSASTLSSSNYSPRNQYFNEPHPGNLGRHWVADIAVEANVKLTGTDKKLTGPEGALILDIVKAGVHYECRINTATGQATLSILQDGKELPFTGAGKSASHPVASTSIRSTGSYHVRFANVDNQLTLWVNENVAQFDNPTTYTPEGVARPKWTEKDPLDAAPAGIGVRGVGAEVTSARILRDVYYVAQQEVYDPVTRSTSISTDAHNNATDYNMRIGIGSVINIMQNPDLWSKPESGDPREDLFAPEVRRATNFWMNKDNFFPMGDNSPASKDARLWGEDSGPFDPRWAPPEPFVHRKFLTGKALLIYWPHHWNSPVPFTPNFRRMGLIR